MYAILDNIMFPEGLDRPEEAAEPLSQRRQVERSDLPGMIATLYSYEDWFGPYHPQTLRLMTEVALMLWDSRDIVRARPLLERTARDCGRYFGREWEPRARLLAALRDLYLEQAESEKASAVQKELWESTAGSWGLEHPQKFDAANIFRPQ
jgi:hypothetical protein